MNLVKFQDLLTSISASGSGLYDQEETIYVSASLGEGKDWLSTPTFPDGLPKALAFGLSSHGAHVGLIQTSHLGENGDDSLNC